MSHGNDILAEQTAENVNIQVLPVTIPRGLEAQSLKPVLLHLTGKTFQPTAMDYPREKRKQNGETRIMKAFVKLPGSQGVHRPAVWATITLHPQAMGEALKISVNIAMSPQPASLTAGTLMRPRPRKIFALLNSDSAFKIFILYTLLI